MHAAVSCSLIVMGSTRTNMTTSLTFEFVITNLEYVNYLFADGESPRPMNVPALMFGSPGIRWRFIPHDFVCKYCFFSVFDFQYMIFTMSLLC